MNLLLGKNNRYHFSVEEKDRYYTEEYDESDRTYMQTKGTYKHIGDTLFFTADTQYRPLILLYKHNPNVEKNKIHLLINDLYPFGEELLIGKEYASAKILDVSDASMTDENDEVFKLTVEKGDSLFLCSGGYYYKNVMAFAIPAEANELVIQRSEELHHNLLEFSKGYRGENNNELRIIVTESRRGEPVSLFYVTSEIAEDLLQEDLSIINKEYKTIDDFHTFTITREEEYIVTEDDEEIFVVAANQNNEEIKNTSFFLPSSYREALEIAKKENKYLILYREESSENTCPGNVLRYLDKGLKENVEVKEFNENFVFYLVPDKEKKILDNKKEILLPVIKIQTGEEEMVFYEEGTCIQEALDRLLTRDPERLKEILDIHYLNTGITNKKTKTHTEELKKLEKQLRLILSAKEANSNSVNSFKRRYEKNENHSFEWNLDLPEDNLAQHVEKLICFLEENNIYDNEKVLELIIESTDELIRDGYSFAKDNQLSPALSYLLKVYEKNPQKENRAELFDKAINYLWCTTCQDEIDARPYYYLMAQISPSNTDIFVPLMVNSCFKDEEIYFNEEPVYHQMIADFMNKVTYENATENLDNIFDNLFENKKSELLTLLSRFIYMKNYDNPKTRKNMREQYLKIVATSLNNEAWHIYEFTQVQDLEKLFRASRWAEASLELHPNEPHTLDTYSHLLYRLGRKREAVQVQEKGMEYIDDLNTPQEKRNMRKAYFLMKNDTNW